MGRVQTFAHWNTRASEWLDAHPVVYFVGLVTVPLLVYVAFAWLLGDSLGPAALRGLAFGLVFAIASLLLDRWRS